MTISVSGSEWSVRVSQTLNDAGATRQETLVKISVTVETVRASKPLFYFCLLLNKGVTRVNLQTKTKWMYLNMAGCVLLCVPTASPMLNLISICISISSIHSLSQTFHISHISKSQNLDLQIWGQDIFVSWGSKTNRSSTYEQHGLTKH